MCGICGHIGWKDDEALDRMMRRMFHRGPDDEGRHVEPGLALGIRRLQVIDPTGGHQPISNETGTIWVVLNGEIYNYRELRKELIHKGHRFQTQSDTEILVHLYEQEGVEGMQRLRGMFAFALWDGEKHTLWVVRDRFGIKPLYYTIQDNGVAFASELPALLAALPSWSVRPHAIVHYLNLLYVPGPKTVFEGIYQLPPGNMLKVADGKVEILSYARLNGMANQGRRTSLKNLEDDFLEQLMDSVKAHLVSDVPLGLFLSGGLDSASILAMMRGATNGRIRTFSIGYESREDQSFDELSSARMVATHFGADHTEERLSPDVVKLLPQIVSAMGEPFADASAIPTYLVSQLARRFVTVALSGIGGDELFGGYPRYLGIRLASRYAHLPWSMRHWLAGSLAPRLPELAVGQDQIGRVKRFLGSGFLPLPDQYWRWMTFLPSHGPTPALMPDFQAHQADVEIQDTYCKQLMAWPSEDPADQAMGLDLQTYLPEDLLRMGDRLSMHHSLELRVPFCDHQLLAFALHLPASVRFSGWRLKGFMRRALRAHLPRTILKGPKRGFMVPMGRWLREDLREMVHDLLSDDRIRLRGYVRPQYVQWLIQEHEKGTRNFTDQLFALLVLELWHETIKETTYSCTLTA